MLACGTEEGLRMCFNRKNEFLKAERIVLRRKKTSLYESQVHMKINHITVFMSAEFLDEFHHG